MPISIKCSKCGQGYRVREEMAGKRAKCKCGEVLDIPKPGPASEPDPMMDLLDQEFPEEAAISPPPASRAAASPPGGLSPVAGPSLKRPSNNAGPNPVLVIGIAAGGVVGLVLIGLVIFLFSSSGDSSAPGPGAPPGPAALKQAKREAPGAGGYATPEEAYEARKKATIEKDWETFFDVVTPESQDTLVGGFALIVTSVAAKNQQAAGLLKQHGVDETVWKEESPEKMPKDPKDAANVLKKIRQKQQALVAAIDDKRAFFVEGMDRMPLWMKTVADSTGQDLSQIQAQAEQAQAKAKLSDVRIDGDRATAKESLPFAGRAIEQPVHFRRIGGRWYIHLPDAMMR